MKEYIDHTGDTTLAKELYEKLISVMEVFVKNADGGLAHRFAGDENWNFYDWSDGANFGWNSGSHPDVYVNCLFLLALDSYEKICKRSETAFPYIGLREELTPIVRDAFMGANGLFGATKSKEKFSGFKSLIKGYLNQQIITQHTSIYSAAR